MIKRIMAAVLSLSMLPFAVLAGTGDETVQQISYWKAIGIAFRDLIFVIMFIVGIVIFFIAVIILVKDYVMADAQRGDKKFSIGELGLGVLLAGALISPYGLLQVGADAAGGSQGKDKINESVFEDAQDNQDTTADDAADG